MTTLSHKDATNKFNEYIKNNKIANNIFGNVLIVSIILTFMLLFIFESCEGSKISQILYSLLVSVIILLVTTKTIKNTYTDQTESTAKEFKEMMNNNLSGDKIKIIGQSEPRPRDIEEFLA